MNFVHHNLGRYVKERYLCCIVLKVRKDFWEKSPENGDFSKRVDLEKREYGMEETEGEGRKPGNGGRNPDCRKNCTSCGGVAQLGEHLPCKQGVRSSILLISTTQWMEKEGRSTLIHALEKWAYSSAG